MQQLLPSILASTSIALLLGAAVLWLLRRKPDQRPLPTEWTLTARPVFSTDERRVYRQLREALPHHVVLSKLPLLRFCQPTDPREARSWYALLSSSSVSFAVCSANGRVLAALDLDSDRPSSSRRSVLIKESVLAACRVRYLRCRSDHLPSVAELQLLVPHSGAAARGPQPAPTVPPEGLPADAGPQRRRRALWEDSRSMQDSFFGIDGLDSGQGSGFGLLRDAAAEPGAAPAGDEAATAVRGGLAASLRH